VAEACQDINERGDTHEMHGEADVARIEILHVPNCPFVGPVRETVMRALARADIPAVLRERVGDYPSPTLLVDGIDVTGQTPAAGACCRLDLPTEVQVLAALRSRGW
jgi:hypothetical protein